MGRSLPPEETTELRKRRSAYRYDNTEEQVKDDSKRDGRIRKRKRDQRIREIVILAVFAVLTIGAIITVRVLTKDDTEPTKPVDTSFTTPSESVLPSEPSDSEPEIQTSETEPSSTEPPTVPTTLAPPAPSTAAPSKGFPEKMNLIPGVTMNPQHGGIVIPSWIVQDLLPIDNVHGRQGNVLGSVKHVVIHYVGNTLSQAKDNRDYFAYQQDGRNVSSNFVVGLYGEIIQCVPVGEQANAQGVKADSGRVNHNYDSLSIETCHYNDAGQFTNETYQSLVKLTAFLLEAYHLPATASPGADDSGTILMHYHCSGKSCPKAWADDPDHTAYKQFVADVAAYMAAHPNIAAEMP